MGPGILWALSSVGAGEVYYSARIGARYQYDLLWAGLLVVVFTWVIISEIGRYTVVSGKTVLHAYEQLPGPGKWPVWFLFVTQILDLTASTTGHAALAATILLLVIPGSVPVYATVLVLLASAVVIWGAHRMVSRVTAALAFVLLIAALATVAQVFPGFATLTAGFVPSPPQNLDLYFVLPWVGFLLIHGAPWFSYWIGKQGFGGELRHPLDELAADERPTREQLEPWHAGDDGTPGDRDRRRRRLHGWRRLMVQVAAVGSVMGALFAFIFVTLGAEVLSGGDVPSGAEVGRQLARGLGDSLGQIGFWLFVLTAAGAFWTTVLDVDDGAARLLADGTLILLPDRLVGGVKRSRAVRAPDRREPDREAGDGDGPAGAESLGSSRADAPLQDAGPDEHLARAHQRRAEMHRELARAHEELAQAEEERAGARSTQETSPSAEGARGDDPGAADTLGQWLLARHRLVSFYVIVFATILPIGLLLLIGDPMKILAVAGIVSAAQAPFFAAFTLWANHRLLPREFRPNWAWSTALALAGLFFATVSTLYFLGLLGFKPF